MRFTYVGGPTALVEFGGVRLLTDPTFDAAGTRYELPAYTLEKTQRPAIDAAAIGAVDAVLLSHDHHVDNLDRAGRELLSSEARVLTTVAGAGRLAGAAGLEPWNTQHVVAAGGHSIAVTATPARHGPEGGDRGPVIGFALRRDERARAAVYVSGDTVWFDGVAEVARRFDVRVAILFLGAARVSAAGPHPLTFTADEAVTVARAMPDATIVPLHFEGWLHFSQGRRDVDRAFTDAGMGARLLWPAPGRPVEIRCE